MEVFQIAFLALMIRATGTNLRDKLTRAKSSAGFHEGLVGRAAFLVGIDRGKFWMETRDGIEAHAWVALAGMEEEIEVGGYRCGARQR